MVHFFEGKKWNATKIPVPIAPTNKPTPASTGVRYNPRRVNPIPAKVLTIPPISCGDKGCGSQWSATNIPNPILVTNNPIPVSTGVFFKASPRRINPIPAKAVIIPPLVCRFAIFIPYLIRFSKLLGNYDIVHNSEL